MADDELSGWNTADNPPSDSRRVHLLFGDGKEGQGFYWSPERLWYVSDGNKSKRNAVKPTHWAEGVTIREVLSRLVSDDDIGLMT